MEIHYVMYISTAKKLMTEDTLLDILMVARKKNEANNITGMLLYSGGTFIQVLEGQQRDVEKVYKSIATDPRHKNVIKLISGFIPTRIFPTWRMGFASINADTLQEFEGFVNPALPNYLGDDDHAVISMLKTFSQANHLTDW